MNLPNLILDYVRFWLSGSWKEDFKIFSYIDTCKNSFSLLWPTLYLRTMNFTNLILDYVRKHWCILELIWWSGSWEEYFKIFSLYWLTDYVSLYILLKNFSLIWQRHHYQWRAAKFRHCLAFRSFEQEGSLSCHIWCNTGPWFFRSPPKNCRIQSPLMTHKGLSRIYSNMDPHGSSFSHLLRHPRGCGVSILSCILTGSFSYIII
jgi:hypothetical protein